MTTSLTCVGTFTQGAGTPATGLTLSEIDMYLTRVDSDGAVTVLWDGTENPTVEVTNVGKYARILNNADLDRYSYHLAVNYTGATVLDSDWSVGSVGGDIRYTSGAVEWTYTITDSVTGLPIEGVDVWISTDINQANIVYRGLTDAFGVLRSVNSALPFLDPGTYYIWRQRAGYSFDNPDTEVVA